MLEERAAAWKLLGQVCETGWEVIRPMGWDPKNGEKLEHYNGTGGNFSVPYEVQRNGQKAFMKAIDFTSAMNSPNVLEELKKISDAHHFEAEILRLCDADGITKVVTAIESGQISLGLNLQDTAPYLIFELAEGDVRKRIPKDESQMRLAWWLRSLHHTSIGLSQLHHRRIAHQDLKPSNILSFSNDTNFKIADLGRCVSGHVPGPYDDMFFAGDWGYAPPEILYGYSVEDWETRRLGCDLYLLGSMIFFYVFGYGMTMGLVHKLHSSVKPFHIGGSYNGNYEDILPHLQTVFSELLIEFEAAVDQNCKVELTKALSELCSPDPVRRGHPLQKTRLGSNFNLERYISLFDRLAASAEWKARRQRA